MQLCEVCLNVNKIRKVKRKKKEFLEGELWGCSDVCCSMESLFLGHALSGLEKKSPHPGISYPESFPPSCLASLCLSCSHVTPAIPRTAPMLPSRCTSIEWLLVWVPKAKQPSPETYRKGKAFWAGLEGSLLEHSPALASPSWSCKMVPESTFHRGKEPCRGGRLC